MPGRTRLATRITAARRKLGPQRKVAALLGVTPHALADWETGRHVPRPSSLRAIAAVLELSYDELVQLRWAAVEAQRRARERAAA